MHTRTIVATLIALALFSSFTFAGGATHQTGRIVKVEKQAAHSTSGGTDTPAKADVDTYHISIQLDDKIYICQYKAGSETDLSWVEGKDVQARVKGKAIYVKKVNGKEAKGSILSTAAAAKP